MICSVSLSKPSCVAAFAAQLLHSLMVGKSAVDPLRPAAFEDLFHSLLMQIAQSQITLVIQAAGDDRSVAQNAQLIPQPVAENLPAAVLCGQIRPVELVAVFQKYPVSHCDTLSPFLPGLGESFLQHLQDLLIHLISAPLIPKSQYNDLFPLGRFGKGKTLIDVLLKGNIQLVSLKGMERNVDFVQPGAGKEQLLLLLQEASVGSQDHMKSRIPCKLQKWLQQRVKQRLTHKVKVQIIRPRTEFGQQGSELLQGHGVLFALCAGAEIALQVTQIGDFQIDLSKPLHDATPFFLYYSILCRL